MVRRFVVFLPSLLAFLLLAASAYEWRRCLSQWDSLELICPWFSVGLRSEEAAGFLTWKPHPQGFWDVFTDSFPIEGETSYLSPVPMEVRSTPDGVIFSVPFLYTTLAAGLGFVIFFLWDLRRWRRLPQYAA